MQRIHEFGPTFQLSKFPNFPLLELSISKPILRILGMCDTGPSKSTKPELYMDLIPTVDTQAPSKLGSTFNYHQQIWTAMFYKPMQLQTEFTTIQKHNNNNNNIINMLGLKLIHNQRI